MIYTVIVKKRDTGERTKYAVEKAFNIEDARDSVIDEVGGKTNVIRCLALVDCKLLNDYQATCNL